MGNALYIFSVDGKKIAELSIPPGIANTLLGTSNSQALIFNVTDDNSSGQCLYTSHIILVNIK
jgi:hypothetical protein